MTKPIIILPHRGQHEPSHAQIKAGNYRKRKLAWRGLTISIENEAGSVRRGVGPDGTPWETRMVYPYGYINRTEGVDGDQVDVYLGEHLDAPTVYVVHQRKVGDWDKYDEDKCFVGFESEEEARRAFLRNYDDPRFLGPITAMPAEEFIEKAKATKDKPQMIKAILFLKGHVGPYLRGGKVVSGYESTRTASAHHDDRQGDLFEHGPAEPAPSGNRKHYVTVVRNAGTPHQKVGWLAGPFDSHHEARAHVDRARAKAREIDPFTDFDAFGTSSREADHHPPGVLNRHLGLDDGPGSGKGSGMTPEQIESGNATLRSHRKTLARIELALSQNPAKAERERLLVTKLRYERAVADYMHRLGEHSAPAETYGEDLEPYNTRPDGPGKAWGIRKTQADFRAS